MFTSDRRPAWPARSRSAQAPNRELTRHRGSLGPTFGGGPPVFTPSAGSRFYSYSSFAAMDKVWLHLQMNEATGDGGTCYGDSGGPNFLWQDGQETSIIAGVTVKGDAMCVATNLIYRLDTPTARRFLERWVALPKYPAHAPVAGCESEPGRGRRRAAIAADVVVNSRCGGPAPFFTGPGCPMSGVRDL